MPAKKKYPDSDKSENTKEPTEVSVDSTENKNAEESKDSSPAPEFDSTKVDESEVAGGELFFSTDGEETVDAKENPYLQEGEEMKVKNPPGSDSQTQVESSEINTHHSAKHEKTKFVSGEGHSNRMGKKQNWQEKKKQKNRPRSKFKRPRKLPYEDTESKSLEMGNLMEDDQLKTEAGLIELAEEFVGSENDPISLNVLLALDLQDLKEKARSLPLSLNLSSAPLREEILDAVLLACLESKTPVRLTGILQVMEDGHGFILQQKEDYRIKSQSPFVPEPLIEKYGLKTGHLIKGFLRSKKGDASCPIVLQIEEVMGGEPERASRTTPFTELIPYYPLKRIYLETNEKVEWDNVSMRVVDLVSPIGFGQRGLIVAPPRTGKTVLQQSIARALRINNPQAHLIVLLVDERPEEVTDFRRQVPDAEVIASTFDESAESHVHAAEIVIEKARRMVEHENDVVILLDSITRLARAYNTTMPNSGKILSGGVEATALQRPKRFFGSARNIEGGGSLTILGTALVETGSKMDEVIFEEFKGTGNMELHLDRELSNKRIFPALDFEKSGTRKEELLYHPDELTKIYSLRRSLKGVPPAEAMEMFIQRVRKTKSNPEFLMGLGR